MCALQLVRALPHVPGGGLLPSAFFTSLFLGLDVVLCAVVVISVATWPRACTPASVRPAKEMRWDSPVNSTTAASSTSWTVRRAGCACDPAKSVPS